MTLAARKRSAVRGVILDRALEELPFFRLSDSADDTPVSFIADNGGRWRVIPTAGDRLPGTFDQDVYVELLHRYSEMGAPADGAVTFTLHAFLRSMGRRADGRTYEQLRAALTRLERTTLESVGLTTTPYHAHVPSFGEWGFILASRRPYRMPTVLPAGLRFLSVSGLSALFDFPPDMARVPAEVNRLSNQVLVQTFEAEWGKVNP